MRLALVCALVAGSAGCAEEYPWQAEAAQDVRELPMLQEVDIVRMTREEFSAQAADRADNIDPSYFEYFAQTYGRLGYFDPSIDLRPVFAGSSSDWVGATYSPSSKRITLVGDASDQTFVHEFVHALQDQNFNIVEYDAPETSDSFLARRAVVEGDAMLAQYRFGVTYEGGLDDLHDVNWESALGNLREFSTNILVDSDYPAVFLDYVSFVYTYGMEYSAANLTGVTYDDPTSIEAPPYDWGAQDLLYTDVLPDSTQQILRRDVGDGAADPVEAIGLGEVPIEFTDRLETVDWDRLGEWYVYLLFFPMHQAGEVDARALASAWDGDAVLFAADVETGDGSVVWASVWDDDAAAAAIEEALWQLYGRSAVKGGGEWAGTAADGELVWLERRGNRLVMAKNLSLDLAADLAEAAFATGDGGLPARKYPSIGELVDRRLRGSGVCGHGHPTRLVSAH
jgi:hypothetical protein